MKRLLIASVLLASVSFTAGAQRLDQAPRQQPANRAQLEQRVRQALARVAKQRLELTDDQMQQLARVDQDFANRRRELNAQEREIRVALGAAMRDTANPDQPKIASYIDQLIATQHKRIDLVAQQQKALSAFMTPLQRAQYQALQERVRRRLQQMRQGGGRGPARPDSP